MQSNFLVTFSKLSNLSPINEKQVVNLDKTPKNFHKVNAITPGIVEKGPRLSLEKGLICQKHIETDRDIAPVSESPRHTKIKQLDFQPIILESPTPNFISPKGNNNAKRQMKKVLHSSQQNLDLMAFDSLSFISPKQVQSQVHQNNSFISPQEQQQYSRNICSIISPTGQTGSRYFKKNQLDLMLKNSQQNISNNNKSMLIPSQGLSNSFINRSFCSRNEGSANKNSVFVNQTNNSFCNNANDVSSISINVNNNNNGNTVNSNLNSSQKKQLKKSNSKSNLPQRYLERLRKYNSQSKEQQDLQQILHQSKQQSMIQYLNNNNMSNQNDSFENANNRSSTALLGTAKNEAQCNVLKDKSQVVNNQMLLPQKSLESYDNTILAEKNKKSSFAKIQKSVGYLVIDINKLKENNSNNNNNTTATSISNNDLNISSISSSHPIEKPSSQNIDQQKIDKQILQQQISYNQKYEFQSSPIKLGNLNSLPLQVKTNQIYYQPQQEILRQFEGTPQKNSELMQKAALMNNSDTKKSISRQYSSNSLNKENKYPSQSQLIKENNNNLLYNDFDNKNREEKTILQSNLNNENSDLKNSIHQLNKDNTRPGLYNSNNNLILGAVLLSPQQMNNNVNYPGQIQEQLTTQETQVELQSPDYQQLQQNERQIMQLNENNDYQINSPNYNNQIQEFANSNDKCLYDQTISHFNLIQDNKCCTVEGQEEQSQMPQYQVQCQQEFDREQEIIQYAKQQQQEQEQYNYQQQSSTFQICSPYQMQQQQQKPLEMSFSNEQENQLSHEVDTEDIGIQVFETKKQRYEIEQNVIALENRINKISRDQDLLNRKIEQKNQKANLINNVKEMHQKEQRLLNDMKQKQQDERQRIKEKIIENRKDHQKALRCSQNRALREKAEQAKEVKYTIILSKSLKDEKSRLDWIKNNEKKNQIRLQEKRITEQKIIKNLYNKSFCKNMLINKIKTEQMKHGMLENKLKQLEQKEKELIENLERTYQLNRDLLENK